MSSKMMAVSGYIELLVSSVFNKLVRTYLLVLPKITLLGTSVSTSPEMKSSNEGPSASFLLKSIFDEDGIASDLICVMHLADTVLDELARRTGWPRAGRVIPTTIVVAERAEWV